MENIKNLNIEAGRDAERYRWLCDVATEQQWVELGGYTVKKIIDGAIDALRGEAKPIDKL